MGIIENAKEWLISIALKKAATRMIQVGLAYLLALPLQQYGINIDHTQATIAITGALEMLRNYLKVKFGWTWL